MPGVQAGTVVVVVVEVEVVVVVEEVLVVLVVVVVVVVVEVVVVGSTAPQAGLMVKVMSSPMFHLPGAALTGMPAQPNSLNLKVGCR